MPTVCFISVSINNVSLQFGQTALHRASSSGHTGVVKLLVESGAQVDNKTNVSIEPFMLPLSPPTPHFLLTSYILFSTSLPLPCCRAGGAAPAATAVA